MRLRGEKRGRGIKGGGRERRRGGIHYATMLPCPAMTPQAV